MFGDGIFEIFKEKEEEEKAKSSSEYENPSYSSTATPKTFVISIGGSAIIKTKINTAFIAKLAQTISDLQNEGFRFAVVVGGGKTARDYQAAGRALGAKDFHLDDLGIRASRMNAMLIIQALENAYPRVLKRIIDASSIIQSNKIPVYGGVIPGFTTDTVSALLCETLNADFINLSNVDGVYSADPRDNPKAKFYPHLTHNELLRIVAKSTSLGASPGQNVILDLPCALILKRSKIRTMVLNAEDLENIKTAVRGGEFKGTLIETETEEVE